MKRIIWFLTLILVSPVFAEINAPLENAGEYKPDMTPSSANEVLSKIEKNGARAVYADLSPDPKWDQLVNNVSTGDK